MTNLTLKYIARALYRIKSPNETKVSGVPLLIVLFFVLLFGFAYLLTVGLIFSF